MTSIYVHTNEVHNTKAARQIVPLIINLFNPKSVIDVGCGIGTWGAVFKDSGVQDYLGLDGDYVDRSLLIIPETNFLAVDLAKGFLAPKKFDIAISLEVAEHLPESSSEIFVGSLVAASDTVIFSAAIVGQEGQNHLNEQFPEYWKKKFESHNYSLIYHFAPDVWNNKDVEWWYQQNIMVYQKRTFVNKQIELKLFIHPQLYKKKLQELDKLKKEIQNISEGKIEIKKGLKIFLKSLLHSVK